MKRAELDRLIRRALREDFGRGGDVTTDTFLSPAARLEGVIVAKQDGVLAGIEVAARALRLGAPGCRVKVLARDGARLTRGRKVLRVQGGRALLSAERVALNFLQRLSGVATLTRAFVERTRGTRARILDTRKTTPGLRVLEKEAVVAGGGRNHRMRLDDLAMIKDNHLAAVSRGEPLARRIRALRRKGVGVEIEAKTTPEVDLALELGADIILLDNMTPARVKAAVKRIRARAPKTLIEVSGGVNLKTVRGFARLGVDRISVGALTHSAPALDFSLEIA